MKKIKRFIYPFIHIVLPFIIVIIIAIKGSSILELIDYSTYGLKFNFSELSLKNPRVNFSILLIVIQWFVIRSFITKDKEFAKSDFYGDYPLFIYTLAYWVMGYKVVDLKMKPIPLQFSLLHQNIFECKADILSSDKEFKYKVDRNDTLKYKVKQINIIVADTFDILEDKLPNNVKDNYTIKINRIGERRIRVSSQELVDLLHKEIQETHTYCNEYNLFLATPAWTNKAFYEQIFNTRDGFIINIYQQDNKNDFKFKKKPVKIKC